MAFSFREIFKNQTNELNDESRGLSFIRSDEDKAEVICDQKVAKSDEFSPFELEDAILQGRTSKAIEIIKSLRKADSYSGPLLIWIISKITTLAFLASKEEKPQLFLKSNGVWQSKINDYMSFIKKQSDNDLDIMQRNIYDLELALKGMIKKDFWLELESMICRLDVN